MPDSHTPPPEDLDYKTALHEEHHLLEEVDIPILTISATHRDKLAQHFNESFPTNDEVVLSRAHYSMANAVLIAAFEADKTAWLTDPMNYVTLEDWSKVTFTEYVGQLMARYKPLKLVKDAIDSHARSKLPITPAIQEPLKYLVQNIRQPIISLHYEVGNILAQSGKQVVQVVTDPHVRSQYLDALPPKGSPQSNPNLVFCVFDEATKTEALLKADALDKHLDSAQVIVTGPPVDPRIVAARKHKNPNKLEKHPLRLAITTSGVGTNRSEIERILDQLHQFCFVDNHQCAQFFLYAGTHMDFKQLYQEFASLNNLPIGALEDEEAPLRILYADNLVEANELLIKYMFPWADGVITKPSGDMTYDAAAAGCFTLFLEPWGEWEVNIQERFIDLGIGQDLDVAHFQQELEKFSRHFWEGESWFRYAQQAALALPELFTHGAANIITTTEHFNA